MSMMRTALSDPTNVRYTEFDHPGTGNNADRRGQRRHNRKYAKITRHHARHAEAAAGSRSTDDRRIVELGQGRNRPDDEVDDVRGKREMPQLDRRSQERNNPTICRHVESPDKRRGKQRQALQQQ